MSTAKGPRLLCRQQARPAAPGEVLHTGLSPSLHIYIYLYIDKYIDIYIASSYNGIYRSLFFKPDV